MYINSCKHTRTYDVDYLFTYQCHKRPNLPAATPSLSGASLAKVCYWHFSCSPTAMTDQSVSSSNMWRGPRQPGNCFHKADVRGWSWTSWLNDLGTMRRLFINGTWWNYIVYFLLVQTIGSQKLLEITQNYSWIQLEMSLWARVTRWPSAARQKFCPMGRHGAWLVDHSHGCLAGAELALLMLRWWE